MADSKVATRDLIKAVQKHGGVRPSRRDEILEAKARASREIHYLEPQSAYLKVIREVLPRDGFFVEEVSQVGFASWIGFPVYKPRTYVTCGYQGTLGFGFPTALGVKAANPDKAVISVAGDGGFMFRVQELATAWREVSRSLTDQHVTSLIAREGVILAGTRNGVFRSDNVGQTLRAASAGLKHRHIRWLAYHPGISDREFAGTEPAGIFISHDGAQTWRECGEVAQPADPRL